MTDGIPVEARLTEAAARRRIIDQLTDTLRLLPAGVSLTWQHPEFPETVFGDATVVSCVDDDSVPDPPYNIAAMYWVAGVPTGKRAQYLELFVRAWDALGWRPLRDNADPRMPQVRAGTPDRYLLTLRQNLRGDLSVSVSSPCFPHDKRGGDVNPSTINHP